jgi:thymidylate kinase
MQERWDCVEWKDFENRLSSAKKEAALKNLANFVINADQSPDKVFEDIFSIISKKL